MKKQLILLAAILFFALAASPDAQAQWVQTNCPNSDIFSMAVSDTNLLVGCKILGTGTNTVFRSTDNGASWTGVSKGLPSANFDVSALAVMGTNLFAGTSQRVYLATDNGLDWSPANTGLPASPPWVNAFAVLGTDLFVGLELGGVYRSTEYGKNWIPVNTGLPANAYLTALAVNGSELFEGTYGNGVFRSTDQGTSWSATSLGMTNTHVNALAVSRLDIFAGTDGGIFRSTDNGMTWTAVNSGLPDSIQTVVSAFAVGSEILFAGTAQFSDNTVFRSTDNGTSWSNVGAGLPGSSVTALAVIGKYLIAGTSGSGVWRRPLSELSSTGAVARSHSLSNKIQSFPNPFSKATTINFSSPESGVAEVRILNILGNEVARLFNGELTVGEHYYTWDASGMPSGSYWCQLRRTDGRTDQTAVMKSD